jgi:hypothetical protein
MLTAERIQQLEDLGFVFNQSGLRQNEDRESIDSVEAVQGEERGKSKHLRSRFCCLACHPASSYQYSTHLTTINYFCEQDCLVLMATMLMLALPSGSIVNVQPMHPWRKEAPNPSVKENAWINENFVSIFTVHLDKWMDHWKMLKEYRINTGTCRYLRLLIG